MQTSREMRRRGTECALLVGGAVTLLLLCLQLPGKEPTSSLHLYRAVLAPPATFAQDAVTKQGPPRYSLHNWAIILICLAVVAGVMLILLCVFAVTYCAVVSRKGWVDFRAYFTHMAP